MTPEDTKKLLTIRMLQRDMLLFAASNYLEALDACGVIVRGPGVERATLNLRLATQKVEAELI